MITPMKLGFSSHKTETSCSRPVAPLGTPLTVEGSGRLWAGVRWALSFSGLAPCSAGPDGVFRLSLLAAVFSFMVSSFVTDCLSLSIVLSCVRIKDKEKEGEKYA